MAENHVIIEKDLCKGCGYCVQDCPEDCLSMSSGINSIGYRFAVFDSNGCTACGLCFYVCPEPGAVTVIQGRGSVEKDSDQGK